MRTLKLRTQDIVFLKQFTNKGKHSARSFKRANVLLLLDKGETGDAVAKKLNVNRDTVYNVKRKYLKEGLNAALYEKQRSGQPVKYDTTKKAEIIAYACTSPPEGRKKWTIRLLAQEMKKQKGFENINRESIRLTLKKVGQNLG